jgi:hypothetical protein
MAGQPAPRDHLGHRTPPFRVVDQRDNIGGPVKFRGVAGTRASPRPPR